MGLERLLEARRVAVIGASENPGRIGYQIMQSLLRSGVEVWPVHSSGGSILGRPTATDIGSLPDGIDLAVVALAAERAVPAAVAAARRGIPFVIPVAGGFSELDEAGRSLQAEMVDGVRAAGGRLLGPNTLGLWVPGRGPDTLFVAHEVELLSRPGCVALLSQSGSVAVEALGVAAAFGYRLRAFVGLGNKADLNEIDLLDHFRLDTGCGCVALYLESFVDARRFLASARSTAEHKPVVVLKAGRTPAGAGAVASHTGALSGSAAVVRGALTQHGVLLVEDDEALLDAARALAMLPPAAGGRVAVLTPAGGYGVLATDAIESSGGELSLARLDDDTRRELARLCPPFAALANPVDLTASVSDDMLVGALRVLLADRGVDLVLMMVLLGPPGMTEGVVERLAEVARASSKPVVVLALDGRRTAALCTRFCDALLPAFPSLRRAIEATRSLRHRGRWLSDCGRLRTPHRSGEP